jgi:1-acyl-sn-glycerol-3-phosphate acyltransferase
MIRDAKGGLFTRVIDWYISRKVRSAFRGVWVRGTLPSSRDGLVAYFNHSSFWDGFIVHQLGHAARWDTYAVMEEQNLAKYPFHTRIGAFSIRRGDARSAVETLKYAKSVLGRSNACVVIFPQGEIRAGQGPLGPLSRGVEVLARSSKKVAVPIAVRYAFLEHEHPDVLVEVGSPHAPGELSTYEAALTSVYERVLSARSTEGFTPVVRGRTGVQERWDAVRRLPATQVPSQEGPRQHAAQS